MYGNLGYEQNIVPWGTSASLGTICTGPNAAMSLAISLRFNCLDFLINQVSDSKKGCNPNWSDMIQALMLMLQINQTRLVYCKLVFKLFKNSFSIFYIIDGDSLIDYTLRLSIMTLRQTLG